MESAEMDLMESEKGPSWVPKKLVKQSATVVPVEDVCGNLENGQRDAPPHHDAQPLDLRDVEGFGVFLEFAWNDLVSIEFEGDGRSSCVAVVGRTAIRRVEAIPGDKDAAVVGVAGDGLGGQVEVDFPVVRG